MGHSRVPDPPDRMTGTMGSAADMRWILPDGDPYADRVSAANARQRIAFPS
ncbi:hypothetical protein GCM10009106_01370 [Sphingomonas japonica]